MSTSVEKVTVLGLGTMGSAMARRLVDAGLTVTVWNRSPQKSESFRSGPATVASSAAEAVRVADVVLTMLFDADAVRAVMSDALSAMSADAIWMQSSTIGTVAATQFAEQASMAGTRFVDAPMLGTKGPAESGTLTALLAGDDETIGELAPVLAAVSTERVVAGDAAPAASALKLAANAWIATITAGIGQSLTIAERLGVDPRLVLTALHGTAPDSPYAQLKGGEVLAGHFDPQFEVAGLLKDVRLAKSETPHFAPTLLDALEALYTHTADAGYAAEDIAAVWKAFQR